MTKNDLVQVWVDKKLKKKLKELSAQSELTIREVSKRIAESIDIENEKRKKKPPFSMF